MAHEDDPALLSAAIEFAVGDDKVALNVQVPRAPTDPVRLLPLVHAITGAVVDMAVQAQDTPVRCAKGCGACCRQLVPISAVEARAVAAAVQAMDEARRATVVARFDAAIHRLEDAGMIERLRDFSRIGTCEGDVFDFGIAYFRLGMPCPFLEDEACSIHPDRPVACREYLVTSDPAECADPATKAVRVVRIGAHLSRALPALEDTHGDSPVPRLPLILALEWVARHPQAHMRPGPQLLQDFFGTLARKDLPRPPGLGADAG